MSVNDEDDKKKIVPLNDQETEGGESGESGQGSQGGQSGAIQFHDFISHAENIRDDLLSYDDRKRLLSTHKDTNELRVKNQKEKRDNYKKLKEGKIDLQTFRQMEHAAGRGPFYKTNPILADKAQFSGIDKQVNALPTENMADTNQDKRDELQDALENELRYRLGYSPSPKFNPKPQGPGYQ